ncbi:MAG: hypothetical protein ACM3ZQ_01530 [Bacillota bacterium]
MELPLEQAIRNVERLLRFAAHPTVLRMRGRTIAGADDSKNLDGLKSYLKRLGFDTAVDLTDNEIRLLLNQSSLDRYGQKVGIQVTVTLERRQ